MQDAGIFIFGLLMFLILAVGLVLTLQEFRRMGSRDQKDTYPRSR